MYPARGGAGWPPRRDRRIGADRTELTACYVRPGSAPGGVGSALVAELERIALCYGLTHLQLHSSVTAEPFYRALGYDVEDRVEHVLASGERMAAVKMRKRLYASYRASSVLRSVRL